MKRNPLDCPHCGKLNDMHECPNEPGAVPQNGDFTICIGCGQWSVFDQGSFRLPTMMEWGEIGRNKDCSRIENAWQQMKKQMGLN